VDDVTSGRLRSDPSIAARPARVRSTNDLLRLLPYLMPYRVRWLAMIVIAIVSLVATVAIPLTTKAVIDGPVTALV
jgi:ATP-binding cassette subfamily B protein